MSFNHNVRKYYGGGGLLERLINGIKSRVNDPNQPKAWGYSTPQEKPDTQQPAAPQDYSWMKGGTRQRTADEEVKLKDPAVQKYLNRQQGSTTQPNAPVGPKKTPINWGNKFNDFVGGLSEEQQSWLKDNGLNDATKLQDYLTNMGFGVGKFGSDGKFGKDSRAAWDKFAASGIMGKNRDQEIYEEKQKEIEPVIDAEDPFGYKTSNTYEGNDFMSKVKGMGIKSNADLINFMHNSEKEGWKGDAWQTQFRSDVDKALGGDYSDANIRKVFGTQGKWGRGFMGRGDFGDFQNALQKNAGAWNGAYDNNKQGVARMEAGRQQYAAKQAQQYAAKFTPQLSKPTVEDPSKKFMLGNTGIGTLGDQPGFPDAMAGDIV